MPRRLREFARGAAEHQPDQPPAFGRGQHGDASLEIDEPLAEEVIIVS
jgi:hypothetical protein